jgi:hypothetical protein
MADQGRKSDLHGLKIALQVMSHDGLKILVPALTTLIGVATCAGLFVWSLMELQKFSPDNVAMTRIELPAQSGSPPTPKPIVVAERATVVRKAKKKAKKPTALARAPRRYSSARTEDALWDTDNPTGGRVTRSNGFFTEYHWD